MGEYLTEEDQMAALKSQFEALENSALATSTKIRNEAEFLLAHATMDEKEELQWSISKGETILRKNSNQFHDYHQAKNILGMSALVEDNFSAYNESVIDNERIFLRIKRRLKWSFRSEFEEQEVAILEQAKYLTQLAQLTLSLATTEEKLIYPRIMQQANEYWQDDLEEFYQLDEDNNLEGMRELIDNKFSEYWHEFFKAKALLEGIYDRNGDYVDFEHHYRDLLYPE